MHRQTRLEQTKLMHRKADPLQTDLQTHHKTHPMSSGHGGGGGGGGRRGEALLLGNDGAQESTTEPTSTPHSLPSALLAVLTLRSPRSPPL